MENNIYKMPNFLIVGAAKAGTTSIYRYIKDHPDIFMSVPKEPTFFSYADEEVPVFTMGRPVEFVTKYEDYLKLFESGNDKKCRGEASTPYLYLYEKSINNIRKYIPNYINLKIIIILRNPVERAYSHYMMKIRDLTETLTFSEAIKEESTRIDENAHFDFFYLDRGMYYEQVKTYLDTFKNVKVILYDELRNDRAGVINDIFAFLEVDGHYKPPLQKEFNVSGKPKIKFLRYISLENFFGKELLKKIIPTSLRKKLMDSINRYNIHKVTMKDTDRAYLVEYYKKDIKKLEDLLGRDLSVWSYDNKKT